MANLAMDGSGVVRTNDGDVWGMSWEGTLLGRAVHGPGQDSAASRVILRAGFIEDEDTPGTPDPRTWGPRGWDALEAAVTAALSGTGARILVRPAATDVVSDTPSCLRFLERRASLEGGDRLGLLLDPVGMLAPSMMADAGDHLERIAAMVGGHEGVDAVLVRGCGAVSASDVERLVELAAPGSVLVRQA
jgi:hypothetical protein